MNHWKWTTPNGHETVWADKQMTLEELIQDLAVAMPSDEVFVVGARVYCLDVHDQMSPYDLLIFQETAAKVDKFGSATLPD